MSKDRDVDFDRFVKAMEDAAPASGTGERPEIALRHTSGVSPSDWERVQRELDAEDAEEER